MKPIRVKNKDLKGNIYGWESGKISHSAFKSLLYLGGWLLFLLIMTGYTAKQDKESALDFTILKKGSFFLINGESNINKFTCDCNCEDTLWYSGIYKDNILQLDNMLLHVPVQQFNCGNFLIDTNFNILLKSQQFPFIAISVKDIRIPDSANKNMILTKTRLTIAGVTKHFYLPLLFTKNKNGLYTIQGKADINIRDFDINELEKIFGVIRINKNVNIDFQLNFCMKNKNTF
jgi:hypothetical protein